MICLKYAKYFPIYFQEFYLKIPSLFQNIMYFTFCEIPLYLQQKKFSDIFSKILFKNYPAFSKYFKIFSQMFPPLPIIILHYNYTALKHMFWPTFGHGPHV